MTCNRCNSTPCCCASVHTHVPCNQAAHICGDKVVQVNHGETIVDNPFSGGVMQIDRPFSIPACNESAIVSIAGEVATPPEGTQLYAAKDSKAAYLTVIGATQYYDEKDACSTHCHSTSTYNKAATRTELTVINQCLTCNTLPVGTFLAAGSPVLLSAPDCIATATGSSDLVLCDKLHVPEVGETETIVVSPSTSTLSIGDVIQITDKKFQVYSVPGATEVELMNLGEGGAPGTVIDGSDCLSVRIFIVAGENPCDKTAVSEADYIRVCDGGNDTILTLSDGQVAGRVSGKIVGVSLPIDATPKTAFDGCIILNPALDPQEYPLIVTSPEDFVVNDVGYFDCDDQKRRFTVAGIDGSVFTLTPDFTVTALENLADDCTSCLFVRTDCCERLEKQLIDTVSGENTCEAGGVGADYAIKSASVAGNVLTLNGAPEHTAVNIADLGDVNAYNLTSQGQNVTFTVSEDVVNNSCRDMVVLVCPTATAQGFAQTATQSLFIVVEFDNGGGSFGTASESSFDVADDSLDKYLTVTTTRITTIPANTTATLRTRFTLTKRNSGGNFDSTGAHFSGSMRGIAATI